MTFIKQTPLIELNLNKVGCSLHHKIKTCMIGREGVGKTSISRRFAENTFSEKYKSTVGVKIFKKTIVSEDFKVDMIVWDIHGDASFSKEKKAYFLGARAFLLVFDISESHPIERYEENMRLFEKAHEGATIIVVFNKIDIACLSKIEEFKASFPNSFFTSAQTGEGIEELFDSIARKVTG